jgi:hypothetical protein
VLVEPARDGRRRQQVEARHADPAQHADEQIELPQHMDRRDEREGTARDYHRDDEHHARGMAIGQRADRKAGHAAEQ